MNARHQFIRAEQDLLYQLRKAVKEQIPKVPFKVRRLMWWKALVYGGLAISLYASLFFISKPITFFLAYAAFGLTSILLALNFAHDGAHGTIFRSPFWNKVVFNLLYTLVGAHGPSWQDRHIHAHHIAPNVDHFDSDLEMVSLIRLQPNTPWKWYHQWQVWYAPLLYSTYTLFWIFIKDFVVVLGPQLGPLKKNWQYNLYFGVQKLSYLGYLLFLPLAFSKVSNSTIWISFFSMHAFISLFVLLTFLITHHVESTSYPTSSKTGEIQTSWMMNQIKSSNDFHPFSATANFLFGGFNNHVAHHLFPHIPHYYYPNINRIIYPILTHEGIIPNQTTYWQGIRSHFRHLRNLGYRRV